MTENAICRHCGLRIEANGGGRWWHTMSKSEHCNLKARPVSAWCGR